MCCDFDGFTFVCYLFSPPSIFNILSLLPVLVVLMIICHGIVLFWSSLFGALVASCTWMGIAFSTLGKFSVIILLNILHIPFACTCTPSSMPVILRFCLFWSQWFLAYSLHRSWAVWLRVFSFSFNFHFIFKFWNSVFHLF
jgi:hypothetical protein